jgi:hypothetical protein
MRNEAYIEKYAAVTNDEAQRSGWTFYEAVKRGRGNDRGLTEAGKWRWEPLWFWSFRTFTGVFLQLADHMGTQGLLPVGTSVGIVE